MFAKSIATTILICQLGLSTGLAPRAPISKSISHTSPSNNHARRSEKGIIQHQSFQTTDPAFTTSATFLASQGNDNDFMARNNSSSQSDRKTLAVIAGGSLASLVTLATLGIFGAEYTDAQILHDVGITIFTTILSLIFVKSVTKLSANGYLEPRDSRKIIHTLSAPLFMILWPLFSHVWGARLFASFIPLIQAVRLWMAGTNTIDDNELANAISRSGNKEEALGGPFIYVVILFASILIWFCDNLSGVIALSTMAAGDGMADILGRRFGKNNKWFFSESKSIAGTFGFIVSAAACSIGLAAWLIYTNTIVVAMPFSAVVARICFISVASSIVELVPFADDNWTVPIAAAVLASILIQ